MSLLAPKGHDDPSSPSEDLSGWRAIWPGLILLLAALLRLLRLGAQELRGDEAFSYLFARQPLLEIAPALLREGDPHSPLHYYLLHGAMSLWGDGEFALRLPSALLGIGLVFLLWRLAREALGPRPALWVAGLIGQIIQGHVALSGAQAGCQAECGSAAAMAAAAACDVPPHRRRPGGRDRGAQRRR